MLCKNDGPLILIQLAGKAPLHLLHPLCGAGWEISLDHRGIQDVSAKSSVRICCLKSERERAKEGEKLNKYEEREQDNALISSVSPQRMSEFRDSLFSH